MQLQFGFKYRTVQYSIGKSVRVCQMVRILEVLHSKCSKPELFVQILFAIYNANYYVWFCNGVYLIKQLLPY